MTKVMTHYNVECLKCGAVPKVMTSVGVVTMCPECFLEEFHTDDPVKEEREKYLHWLDVHKEMANV